MSYILLVEDNQDNADLVIRTLCGAGYEVRHTIHGLEAAAIVRKARPDLILMDFDLPDIDGRNMVLLLRKQLGGKLAPPIVAVTARTTELDMRIAEKFGCAAFVGKPFLPDDLVSLIRELLKQPSP
jgi:two-component system, cell cycle response regulator DivK